MDAVIASEMPNRVCDRFAPGQVIYAIEWKGDVPDLVGGRIVQRFGDSVTVEEGDGRLLTRRRAIAVSSVFAEPGDAVDAELRWLRWFGPYDRICPSAESQRRIRRILGLEYLRDTLPCAHRFWSRMQPAA